MAPFEPELTPVSTRDPYNGDTERLAANAAAWMAMMTQDQPDQDDPESD